MLAESIDTEVFLVGTTFVSLDVKVKIAAILIVTVGLKCVCPPLNVDLTLN